MALPTRSPVDRWLHEESAGLRALARGLLRSEADADDCVQDAWVAALRAPEPGAPRAWLRGVVRHLAARRWRDAARRERRELVAARPEATVGVADVAGRLEVRRRVLAAVTALEEPYRSAVTLRYLEGRTPAWIARHQGVPVKTVKTRLHRALALLRAALDAAHGGDRRSWMSAVVAVAWPARGLPAAGGAAVAGGLLAMKKTVAVVALLLAVLGIALWRGTDSARPRDESAAAPAPEPALPRLEGTAPIVAAASSTPLREEDAVPAATFAGRVVDARGEGVPGARVDLVWFGAHPGSKEAVGSVHLLLRRERERHEGPTTASDAGGYFRFDRAYESSSFLRAEKAGLSTEVSGPHPSGTFVVLTMERERAIGVVVRTPDDRALEGADVRLVAGSLVVGGWPTTPRQVLAAARTGPDGAARLPVPSGKDLRLEVAPAQAEWGVVERPVTPEDAEVVVRVPAVRVFERRVLDAETGAPVPGAWVDVLRSPESPTWTQETASRRFLAGRDGVVRFPWQEGHYDGYASAPGYEVVWAVEDPIRLPRSFEVEGVVTTSSGAPVAGAAVVVALAAGSVFGEAYVGRSPIAAWSGADGAFRLEVKLPYGPHGLPPPDRGVRSLVALHPDHAAAIVDDVAVRSGGRARVTLRFPRPGSIEVTLVDAAGSPVPKAWVNVGRRIPRASTWPAEPFEFGLDSVALVGPVSYETGPDGRLVRDGLPPGRYLVRAGPLVEEVDLPEGETRRVRIARGLGRFVTGRVVDARGEPVAGATVGLSGAGTMVLPATTGADGSFRFDDLETGPYQVIVHARTGALIDAKVVRSGDDVLVRLPDPARLRLAVEGPPRGTAVEYSLRTFSGGRVGGGAFHDFLAPDGDTPPFTPGEGVLVVRAKGYGWTAVRISAPEGATTRVTVSLPRSGTVEGRVRDPSLGERGLVRLRRLDPSPLGDDRPAIGAASELRSPHEWANPASDGAFRLDDVPPGAYEMSYGRIEEGVWHAVVTERIDVQSGATLARDLTR